LHYFIEPETIEERAARIAEATPEAQLFHKAIDIQNRVVGCLDELLLTYSAEDQAAYSSLFDELKMCTITTSKNIQTIQHGIYIIMFTASESTGCTHWYIPVHNMLAVNIDIAGGSAPTAIWSGPIPFDETVINQLYPEHNCNVLMPYTQAWVDRFTDSTA